MNLAKRVFELNSFKKQYEALIILSVSETIPNLLWNEDKNSLLAKIDWNNILGIASILSYSEEYQHLDSALRISQTCLSLQETNENHKIAAAIILNNLTNKPSIDLAISRELLKKQYSFNIPFSIKLQMAENDITNSLVINNNVISINKFQKKVYDAYTNCDAISISAPTSAGKSYILCAIILEELLLGKKNIVYIVPTRALISQVEHDLRELIRSYKLENVNISTVPQIDREDDKSNIFVFTQERLHWYLTENQNKVINTLIIDEAHKIGDGNRGILLQQKLEQMIELFPLIKIYFSSPFTSNPEILLEHISKSKKENINTQFVAVNQNLLFVTPISQKPLTWQVALCLIDKTIILGCVSIKHRTTTEFKKMAFLVEAISGTKDGNIIYANGAAEAEKTALIVYDLVGEIEISQKITELIKLVKKTIHKDYSLGKVLERRIAFHYGNMPLLIRQEIEKLFKEGEIKYIVCTSTLLEGVNLPAKSIFIRKPRKGKKNPLDQNDFWNLAGRAGRWGKEFSGNIVCIEPKDWSIIPNPNKTKHIITRALDLIEKNNKELLDYIATGSPRDKAAIRQDLEFAFVYYYSLFLDNDLYTSNDFYKELLSIFEPLKKRIIIPAYIIKRNPGISPIAQQDLYDYFCKKYNEIEDLIPVYPEVSDAYTMYTKLVGRIGKTLSHYPHMLNQSRALLLISWMCGKPLSYLISSSYQSYQNNPKYVNSKKLPNVIREVMDSVENFVRFRFANDSSCYVDILRFFFEMNGRQDLIEKIPQLNLWLEFGVSQKTHLSLLSLGLSRNTVIELSEYISSAQLTKAESYEWLKKQNFEMLELSPIILEDIQKVL